MMTYYRYSIQKGKVFRHVRDCDYHSNCILVMEDGIFNAYRWHAHPDQLTVMMVGDE